MLPHRLGSGPRPHGTNALVDIVPLPRPGDLTLPWTLAHREGAFVFWGYLVSRSGLFVFPDINAADRWRRAGRLLWNKRPGSGPATIWAVG